MVKTVFGIQNTDLIQSVNPNALSPGPSVFPRQLVLLHFNLKLLCILLGFYALAQHKEVPSNDVEGKRRGFLKNYPCIDPLITLNKRVIRNKITSVCRQKFF